MRSRSIVVLLFMFVMVRPTVNDVLRDVFDIFGNNIVPMIWNTGSVCFEYVGCFNMTAPWRTTLRPLAKPFSPSRINTTFKLYTRLVPWGYYINTRQTRISVQSSTFNPIKTTHFIIHGMASSGNESWVMEMTAALLTKYDPNVFVVDWSAGATNINYFQVASNIRVVAAEIERLVVYLIYNQGLRTKYLHLIGHSLGSHVAGYVGKTIPNIARITALDPAQPAFEGEDRRVRLDVNDADLVTVIHTDARPFLRAFGLGMMMPAGHVDFYMNGGKEQPGCRGILEPKENQAPVTLLAAFAEAAKFVVSCSHARAYEFFTATLVYSTCLFWGHYIRNTHQFTRSLVDGKVPQVDIDPHCTMGTCIPLGMESVYYPARGAFYVQTASKMPFCYNQPVNDAEMRFARRRIGPSENIW